MRVVPILCVAPVLVILLAAGCSDGPGSEDAASSTAEALKRGSDIATIARANEGKHACSTNSEGGKGYKSSCTGNGGEPEFWCADFARWVWHEAGCDTADLTAAAGSFYRYGEQHGTLHVRPSVGDAVVFNYKGGGVADHVAIVSKVDSNGWIETISGDWDGDSCCGEPHFASTSRVVHNAPAYAHTADECRNDGECQRSDFCNGDRCAPKVMGMTISRFVSPINAR